jgi:hypothetical protein
MELYTASPPLWASLPLHARLIIIFYPSPASEKESQWQILSLGIVTARIRTITFLREDSDFTNLGTKTNGQVGDEKNGE